MANSREQEALRSYGLSLPDATEDHPWGESVLKVNGKVFAFLGHGEDDGVGCGLKLPVSSEEALQWPGSKPSGYGLGRAGWVNVVFHPGDEIPWERLKAWVRESWRAVAPKRLVKAHPELA